MGSKEFNSSCCQRQIKDRDALRNRSVLSIAFGFLLMIPKIEAIFLHGFLAPIIVPAMFLFLAYFLYQDYREHLLTFVLASSGFFLLLYGALFFSLPAASLLGLVLLGFSLAGGVFFRMEKLKEGLLKINVDRVIVLMSALCVLISSMHVLGLMGHIGHFMLHEAFLSIGAVNYSAYLQSAYKGHHYQHAVGPFYNKKTGDIVEINDITISPHFVRPTGDDAKIMQGEAVASITSTWLLPPGTILKSGDFKIIVMPKNLSVNDYRENEQRVQMFFLGLIGVSALVSGIQGWMAYSMFKAVQQFILNISVLCPCVFLVSKPVLIQSLFNSFREKKVNCNIAPSISSIDAVVFDRTHTLYHPSDSSSDFMLHCEAKNLLKRLKDAPKELYILSGHATDGWKKHLESCKKEFEGTIPPENVIFDQKFHDSDGQAKAQWIKELQAKGKKVCMIGDGQNDIKALQQADLSIAIHFGKGGAVSGVLQHANYSITKDQLGMVDQIIEQSTQVVKWINRFSWAAILYHLLILSLVNGGFFLLFASSLPEMIGSIVMCIFCVTSGFLTHKLSGSVQLQSTQCQPLSSSHCHHSMNECPSSCCHNSKTQEHECHPFPAALGV